MSAHRISLLVPILLAGLAFGWRTRADRRES